jgi:hypothetical protein
MGGKFQGEDKMTEEINPHVVFEHLNSDLPPKYRSI